MKINELRETLDRHIADIDPAIKYESHDGYNFIYNTNYGKLHLFKANAISLEEIKIRYYGLLREHITDFIIKETTAQEKLNILFRTEATTIGVRVMVCMGVIHTKAHVTNQYLDIRTDDLYPVNRLVNSNISLSLGVFTDLDEATQQILRFLKNPNTEIVFSFSAEKFNVNTII